jgi:hypothetical protein
LLGVVMGGLSVGWVKADSTYGTCRILAIKWTSGQRVVDFERSNRQQKKQCRLNRHRRSSGLSRFDAKARAWHGLQARVLRQQLGVVKVGRLPNDCVGH